MKKHATITTFFFLTMFLVACAATGPTMTPLEIQSMQTREYEEGKDIVFPSVISVFQDIGYIINQADVDTGLITAESATSSDGSSKFWLGISVTSQTRATAFIETIGATTRVRLNFVNTSQSSYAYGQTDREDSPILDSQPYQNAFEQIESAIFIRSSN